MAVLTADKVRLVKCAVRRVQHSGETGAVRSELTV
jgi:hypothetical protein